MLKALYEKMKLDYLGEARAALIPKKYWSQFVSLGGSSEFQFHIGQMVPKDKKRVLVIGVNCGRDYFYFKARGGHEVWGLDLFPDPEFENLIVGNIEDENALPKDFFDAVIFCAVIEHLAEDYRALLNIKSALKDDGVFILNTIYFGDIEETHIQLYSPKTLKRLLDAAGFGVEKEVQTPSLFWFPRLINRAHHALNAFWMVVFGRTLYRYTLPIFWRLDYFFATRHLFLRRFSDQWVTTLQCAKTASFDYLESNREKFQTRQGD